MKEQMKKHPILFKGEMVRAIQNGSKTQTRRVITPQPLVWAERFEPAPFKTGNVIYGRAGDWIQMTQNEHKQLGMGRCPYGAAGHQLWVRETWMRAGTGAVFYRADGDPEERTWAWMPSIFMLRELSRITLDVVGVRVERVASISEEDARAEGVESVAAYRDLWNSINAKPTPVYSTDDNGKKQVAYYQSFPWEAVTETREHRGVAWFVTGNPWVWVVAFTPQGKIL